MTAAQHPDRPWRIAALAIGGLLVAIAVIGLAGIAVNGSVHRAVERAISFDVELEDRGDDLRVAILEVRHYHRDLLLNNPDTARVALWEQRYEAMIDEVEAVESILDAHPSERLLPDIGVLRGLSETYGDAFHELIREAIDDPAEFRAGAEDLLVPLDDMQRLAQSVDQAGEELAAASFAEIDKATATGTLILIGVILGLGAVGVLLGLAVLRLVTEQRRLVAAEQETARVLADAARARTDFIADASHELRTPLTVLRGNAEVGLGLDDDCAHAEILRDIMAEASRMSRLVDDLLFLARSDAAGVPLELRDVDVGEAIESLADRAELLARDHRAWLVTDLRAGGKIVADVGRIDQALLILVDNGAKYGPPGGTVELSVLVEVDELVIEVRDRGPGIPPDQAAHVFERFYRVRHPGTDATEHGSGLGLAIAAAIIAAHGGRIESRPREGGGTTMRVTLPMAAPGPAPQRPRLDGQRAMRAAPEAPGSGSSRGAPRGG